MPRVHDGKKKRGIFSLSTPFHSHGRFTFDDEERSQANAIGTTGHSATIPPQQQIAAPNSHVQQHPPTTMNAGPTLPQKKSIDIEVHENEGGMSQLTLEGGTQFYSGAVDEDATKASGTINTKVVNDDKMQDQGDDTSADRDKVSKEKEEKIDTMNDGIDDDSVTTMGDKESVDLLQEDTDPKLNSIQDDLAAARNGLTPNKSDLPLMLPKLAPMRPQGLLSPATQTLDRLDAFGSQQGGAELSLNLLKCADEKNDSSKVKVSVDDQKPVNAACDSPEDKTVVGTQLQTKSDSRGVVSFQLLSEAAERQAAVNSHDLLTIAQGKSSIHAQVDKNTEEIVATAAPASAGQVCVDSKPQRDRQPPKQFVARPSMQGLGVDVRDKIHLQGGTKCFKTSSLESDSSDSMSSTGGNDNNDSTQKAQESYTNEVKSVSEDLAKRQCIHELKEYFMSTQNSSDYAKKHQNSSDHPVPPQVPFCIACSHPATKLPHHGLCPKHNDFFNSGSYEILNLLVDGNILKCEACSFHFEKGRPNKDLEHIQGCQKGGKKKIEEKKSERNTSSLGSDAEEHRDYHYHSVSLEDAAASGCRKCQKELDTGIKKNSLHDVLCPRKRPTPLKDDQLEDAAASGCRKCQRQLATGVITDVHHDKCCPYWRLTLVKKKSDKKKSRADVDERRDSRHHPVSLEDAAASGCKKCQSELSTGIKTVRPHDDFCPRKRKKPLDNSTSIQSSKTISQNKDTSKATAFDVGTVVFVESRTWSGINKPGGVARVIKVHVPNTFNSIDSIKYDVSYIIEKRKETMIEGEFVSLHSDYVSPSKDESRMSQSGESDSSDSDHDQSKKCSGKQLHQSKRESDDTSAAKPNPINVDEIIISSAEKKDKDGNPLSEYELLRLRNIKRNEARLKKLGLANAGEKPKSKSKKKTKVPKNTDTKPSSQKRTVPPRHKKKNDVQSNKHDINSNASVERCKEQNQTSISAKRPSSSNDTDESFSFNPPLKKQKHTPSYEDLLIRGAKSGCKKCTLEWQTDKKDYSFIHDRFCPRGGAGTVKNQAPSIKQAETSVDHTPLPPSRHSEQALQSTAAGVKNNTHSITPSPALNQPQPLPTFITQFTTHAPASEDVPAPRGTKWLPCPNPWGNIGYEEGDIVIVSPFQSENVQDLLSIFHQNSSQGIPRRFIFKPFELNSDYLKTHRSPQRGGYTVLCLVRDRAAAIPWGFTVKYHEFGGACLVDSIEKLSPADSARDISGWTSSAESSGLKVFDMIISVNGKSVGGMTEAEFQIELDICGSEVMLVVSRYDVDKDVVESSNYGENTLSEIGMDWNDIGAVTPSVKKKVSFNAGSNQTSLCTSGREQNILSVDTQVPKMSTQIDQSTVLRKPAVNVTEQRNERFRVDGDTNKLSDSEHGNSTSAKVKKNKHGSRNAHKFSVKHNAATNNCSFSDRNSKFNGANVSQASIEHTDKSDEIKKVSSVSLGTNTHYSLKNKTDSLDREDVLLNSEEEEDVSSIESEDDDDENPWLGCVCGKTHPPPIKVFWIQCETCDAWYNVSPECVGFDELSAGNKIWSCWCCAPPIPGLEM